MKIRKANLQDLPTLVRIYNQAITARQTADTILKTIETRKPWFEAHQKERFPLSVAVNTENKIMGYVTLSQYREGRPALRFAVEVSYYIDSNYQRKGVGSTLLKTALKQAKALGFRHVFAILLDTNLPSVRLLEKFDFKLWGHLPEIAEIDGVICGQFYYGRKL